MAKICPSCGSAASDNANFCPNCGKPVPNAAQPAGDIPSEGNAQPQMDTPSQQDQPSADDLQAQPSTSSDPSTHHPAASSKYHMESRGRMAWFKFLIYFQLFVAAFWDMAAGLGCFGGAKYGGNSFVPREVSSRLTLINLVTGVTYLALAGLAILTRMRLARFCENGPLHYYFYIGIHIGAEIFYVIVANIALSDLGVYFSAASVVGAILPNVILLICNIVYFGKRKELFVYD